MFAGPTACVPQKRGGYSAFTLLSIGVEYVGLCMGSPPQKFYTGGSVPAEIVVDRLNCLYNNIDYKTFHVANMKKGNI